MKKLAILATALCVSTLSFASTALDKNSPSLNALANAWKAKEVAGAKSGKPNKHMIYGGDDISPKTTLVSPTAIA